MSSGLGVFAALAAAGALVATPARAADPNRGAELYATNCASCHGGNGVPILPFAPDLTRPQSLLKPDALLLQSIRFGRAAMPGFQGILRDREILDVIAYMRTMLR